MRLIRWSAMLASVALAGCFASEPLEVHITPTSYELGGLKSALATPIVDEVVRLKPKSVRLVACRGIRPPKVIQFERELRARHEEVELKLQLLNEEACPS